MESWNKEEKGEKIIGDKSISSLEDLFSKGEIRKEVYLNEIKEIDKLLNLKDNLPVDIAEALEGYDKFSFFLKNTESKKNINRTREARSMCTNILIDFNQAKQYLQNLFKRCDSHMGARFKNTKDKEFDEDFSVKIRELRDASEYYLETIGRLKRLCMKWIEENG